VFNAAFDGDEAATVHAVEICSACPAELRERCLALAMAAEEHEPERYGVFAGLTPEERTELAGGFLQHPPTEHEPSRASYARGCHCPECTRANASYVAARRAAEPCHTRRDREDVEQLTMWEGE
jgi:hypothetical protein